MRRSPFPGMDPWLETHWRDVHSSLMVYARDALQDQLPGDLLARVEEGVSIDYGDDLRRTVVPDVHVAEEPGSWSAVEPADAAVAVAEPIIVPVSDPRTERHLVIVDASSGNRVVTAVLSPSNKIPGPDRESYRRKQKEYLEGGVNLVEIDLVRAGVFTSAVPLVNIDEPWRTPYSICVRRVDRPNDALVYRAPLRERLPAVRIPLRPSDRDVTLDLQSLIDQCYDRGRYWMMDYSSDPVPQLSLPDAQWADELLRAAGLRRTT